MDKYKKLYVCVETKFIGTSKMFLDKGVDVHDADNTTIYCIDDPSEIAIINGLDTTHYTLKFTTLELNEEYKTAKVNPVLEPIPDDVKQDHTNKFKDSFKAECVDLFNITHNNPLMYFKYNGKPYTIDTNLLSLWMFHFLLRNISVSLNDEGYMDFKFRDTNYDLYLKDEHGKTDRYVVDHTVMDELFSQYTTSLRDTATHASEMYEHVDTYKFEDITKIIIPKGL